MILARALEHMKKQHWTGVFIELVIVVLGVFIGMQVSNWNAAREDALLGRDYVRRLRTDLNKDLAAMQAQTAYYQEVMQAIKRTDKLLPDADADPKTLVINAYRATEIMYISATQATWQQIVSSGHLGLLPKGAVEGGLAGYYSFNVGEDIYKNLNASVYRRVVRDIIPITVQEAIRAGCSDRLSSIGYPIGFRKTCKLDVEPALLRSTAQALRHDPDVAKTLGYQYSNIYSAVLNDRATINQIKLALATLGVADKTDKAAGK